MVKTLARKDPNLARLTIVLLIVIAFAAVSQPDTFFTVDSFQSMGKLLPEYGLLSLGMCLALITGGIDLSVVYIADFCAIFIALLYPKFVTEQTSMPVAIVVAICCVVVAIMIGAIWGSLNGMLIGGIGIPPILATLGTQQLIRGISVIITDGSTVSGIPDQFTDMVNQEIFGVPFAFWVFMICAIIIGVVVSRTTFGYKIRMLGTNPKACTYSGINVRNLTVANYAIIGGISAVAGALMLGLKASAKADYGSSYTMQVIMIAVMGGVAPTGGKGNIQGVVVSVFIIQVISTWLGIFRGLNNLYRQIIWGVLLIIVLLINYAVNERDKKRSMKKS